MLATLKNDMFQFLMRARLIRIALRAAQITIATIPSLLRTITHRLRASDDAFRANASAAGLISRCYFLLIEYLLSLEHAAQLALVIGILTKFQRIVRHLIAFALEMTLGVFTNCRWMTTMGTLHTLVYILTTIVFHFIAWLALAIVPNGNY